MKHVLIVAFHYPPEASSSGVLRTLKYTRYLPQYGWRATVLTVRASAYDVKDPQLEEQIPAVVRVVRTRYMNSKKHFSLFGRYPAILSVPDRWIGWAPWAIAAGRRILQEDPPEVVYSTSPHATSHLIALSLSKYGNLPLVADFRDPWYEKPPEPGTPTVVQWFAPRLERKVIERAAHVITSTEQLRNDLCTRYQEKEPDRIRCILNGFDEEDFTQTVPASNRLYGRLTLLHAGNINAEFRDPRPLFWAISQLVARGELDPSHLRIRFLGPGEFGNSDELRTCLRETQLQDIVEFVPRVPYQKALEELAKADILLLLQASDDTMGLVPAKLYEYLRAQRPVIAVTYRGATTDIIKDTGGGWAIDPRAIDALKEALRGAYDVWKCGGLSKFTADQERLKKYSRKELTRHLAQVFDSVRVTL